MAEAKVKKIRRIAPCPSYDVERIESWLQDMARDGWILEGESAYWLGFFTFVKAQPQEIRYRLEPKTERHSDFLNSPDEDALALYKEYGWEFVTQFHYFYIYRTADPNARELNTDLAVQATALKLAKRNAGSSLPMNFFLIAYWFFRIRKEPFRFLVTFDWYILLPFLILLVTALTFSARQFLHIRRLRKQLKENIPLDHNKPWQKNAKLKRVGKIAAALLEIFVVVSLFTYCFHAMSESYEHTPIQDFPGDPPFVTCADLGEFTPERFLDSYNAYNHYATGLAPNIIEWKEYGTIQLEDGRSVSGSLMIDYYETTSPRIARGLVDDFLRHYETYDKFYLIEAPELDVDYVVAYSHIYPTVLIQHGNIFISATVGLEWQEDYLLEEWAQQMAEYLIK